MQDMLAKGEAWFEEQRRQHLSQLVEYRPTGSLLPRSCHATLVVGKWESLDSAGQIVRMETRDFFIHKDELPQDPKRGDKVAVAENGGETIYEVAIPDGSRSPWRWADRSQAIRRIHTMATQNAVPAASSSLLVVATGVSAAAAITDAQIKSVLVNTLQVSRALTRQLVANGEYAYIVLPNSFGTPVFTVNGLTVTAWTTATRSIEFDGQPARPYTIYRSNYPVTGTLSLGVA